MNGTQISIVSIALLLSASCIGQPVDGPEYEGELTEESQAATAPSCAPARAVGIVPPLHKAMLDTIAYTEGTRGRGQDGYDVIFSYQYFSDCSRHPNRTVCSGAYCSTAAGRYQFLTGTWRSLGLATFHPENQERGGMRLIARRGVTLPSTRPLTATEFANAMDRLSYEWASLPPGRYGQPIYSMTATRTEYCRLAGCGEVGPDAFVIDSDNANNQPARGLVEVSSSWAEASATPGYHGTSYLWAATDAVSDGASFAFYLPSAQTRTIDAFWVAGSNRSSATSFVVFDASGRQLGTVRLDQRQNGSQWVTLGAFPFTSGWNKVVVSRWAPRGAVVIADAIRVR